MARRFASDTTVSVEQTQAEISRLLMTHGATARAVAVDDARGRGVVMFELAKRRIRMEAPLPTITRLAQRQKPRGWSGWCNSKRQEWLGRTLVQEQRATWRQLLLLLRAKMASIQSGATTVEREFLADLLLPDGQTVGHAVMGTIESAYLTGNVPPLLPKAGGSSQH